jgi:hypothetical protein
MGFFTGQNPQFGVTASHSELAYCADAHTLSQLVCASDSRAIPVAVTPNWGRRIVRNERRASSASLEVFMKLFSCAKLGKMCAEAIRFWRLKMG